MRALILVFDSGFKLPVRPVLNIWEVVSQEPARILEHPLITGYNIVSCPNPLAISPSSPVIGMITRVEMANCRSRSIIRCSWLDRFGHDVQLRNRRVFELTPGIDTFDLNLTQKP